MNAPSPKCSCPGKSGLESSFAFRGRALRLLFGLTVLLISTRRLPAPIFEVPEKPPAAPGSSLNADGSRTVYEVDNAHHTALATITERNGKLRHKVRYELDGAGRLTSRIVLDPDGNVRSKSIYKYDKTGRVLEETQLGKDDAVLHKIAYSYDPQTGKLSGHSVFPGNGRSLDQTTAAAPARTPAKSAFGEGPPGG
jgi:hypothetical protein